MLRIVGFETLSTTQIKITFSEALDEGIGVSNVRVRSNLVNIPDLTVKAVNILDNEMTVLTDAQTPVLLYFAELLSTSSQEFIASSGSHLQQDGIANVIFFVGLERENRTRDNIIADISPVYDAESSTLIRDHLAGYADALLIANTDLREVGTANYISVQVDNEAKFRGFGPTDRLNNEGAYEITRVGKTPSGVVLPKNIKFNDARATAVLGADSQFANTQLRAFSSDPISLRSVSVINEVVSNSELLVNKFNGTIVTLSKKRVIRIDALRLRRAGNITIYDIPLYGYALKSNRYDTLHANQLSTLENTQFKIADTAILAGGFDIPSGNDELFVSYTYIDNGINIGKDSLVISQVRNITRETVGSFLTIFFLKNFPIVTAGDAIPTTGGVQFLDPSPATGQPFTTIHPAFLNEIAFSTSSLPSRAGEYSIDYNSGQVFVFGASIADGTGTTPPVATYSYRKTFIDKIDYAVDINTDEVAGITGRDLIGQDVKVSFDFEQVLALNDDYLAEIHTEVLDEPVKNRFINTFTIATNHTPITDAFKIFNQTTGEKYTITRFNNNIISFRGAQAPRTAKKENESPTFTRIYNEPVVIVETLVSSVGFKIVRAELANNNLVSGSADGEGTNVNSDITVTNSSVLSSEYFYDNDLQTVAQNLSKLTINGDFLVDYHNGIIYARVSDTQEDVLSEISYGYAEITTEFNNILSPDFIGYKRDVNSNSVLNVDIDSFTPETISLSLLPSSVERFLAGETNKPIIMGAEQYGVAGQRVLNSSTFTALDGQFTSAHADGNHIIRFPDEIDRGITAVISLTQVSVSPPFTDNNSFSDWCLVNFNASDGYNSITTYDIKNIRAVYSVSDLQTSDTASVVNLYDPNLDTFSENVITFNNPLAKAIPAGTALAIDYTFGSLLTDYTYVADEMLVSYEYGDNSINHVIGSQLSPGDSYFVSYKYGALREPLLTNFGSLTQIEELTSFPLEFDRELYRGAVAGSLHSFVQGPTRESVRTIVNSITNVDPIINELTFNEWTLNRDNLYLQPGNFPNGEPRFSNGKFGNGLEIVATNTFSFPAESYISHRDGTFSAWVRPTWRGLDNDADLIFNVDTDGYTIDGYTFNGTIFESFSNNFDGYKLSTSDIYIGASGYNPTTIPFIVNREDPLPDSSLGKPGNYGEAPGLFIWYDEEINKWKMRWVANPSSGVNFSGKIRVTSSGQFYDVRDGYNISLGQSINEITDNVTSTNDFIIFDTQIDGYEAPDGYIGTDSTGLLFEDGIDFMSDEIHFLMDAGAGLTHNRLSVFKDGRGFLNFRIFDNVGRTSTNRARQFNISHDISNWIAGDLHFINSSWRLNTEEGIDEMHFFVDGQEVSNVFKYGGRPQTQLTDLYRTTANETITSSASKTVLGGIDGQSFSTAVFKSLGSQFITDGIVAGDTLTILDATADGAYGAYTILSVDSETQITLTIPLLLALSNITFSINATSFTVETNIITENVAVFKTDVDGYFSELNGLNAASPDYSVERIGGNNTITILKDVRAGDEVILNTLGLTRGRCRDIVFNYTGGDEIRTNLEPPIDLSHTDIYKIPFIRTAIQKDGYSQSGDGYVAFSLAGNVASGNFTGICQPSNTVTGKTLRLTLMGTDNIDFSGINEVTITGTPGSETISFTSYGTIVSSTLFTGITSLNMTFTALDPTRALGAIEITEDIPLTESESTGDYAQVATYDNGSFRLIAFGSGGLPFNLESNCHYLLDFPTRLSIQMDRKGELFLGSDLEGKNQWNGVLDSVEFLNEMLGDVRTGEEPFFGRRTVTEGYNNPLPPSITPQTLMLLNLDDTLDNLDKYFRTFNDNFITTSSSVNAEFGDAIIFPDGEPFIIDNGETVFNNNAATIEFWVSPLIDTLNDMDHHRYYVDIAAVSIDEVVSITKNTLILEHKSKRIESVRLVTDTGDGINFFDGGSLGVDGKTITLGQQLPGQLTRVKVQYIPVDFNGDRISIYKDGYGHLNFAVLAKETTYVISYPISWRRDTWHRVKASLTANSLDGTDRLRLFIDGLESGTITYGSPGLVYGAGTVYGSAAVGSLGPTFLTINLDLEDTFSEIFIGNSVNRANPSRAKIDNLRFSNSARAPVIVSGIAMDINYNANLETVLPVVKDNNTTAIFNFDRKIQETLFLSNLLDKFTPLFLFDVGVLDEFGRITGDQRAKDLIRNLINRIKPAHTQAFIDFKKI